MELPSFLINTLVIVTEIHIIIRQEVNNDMVQMFVQGSPFSNFMELDSIFSDGNMKAVVQEGPHEETEAVYRSAMSPGSIVITETVNS